MKKQLLTLGTITSCAFAAQNGYDAQSDTATTYRSDACCENSRPCIDCQCYVPQFHNLQCDWGFYLDGEFLYWMVKEDNLPYGAKLFLVSNEATPVLTDYLALPTEPLGFDTEWTPGLRIGLGWNMGCDGWDLYLNWTYFTSSVADSASTPETGETGIFEAGSEVILNNFATLSYIVLDRINAKWTCRFNQIDLLLGRKYWLSRCFAMKPYAGIRGVWTRTTLSVGGGFGPAVTGRFLDSSDSCRDRNWGVGIAGGIEPTFYFANCFALYANIGIATLWAHFQEAQSESFFFSSSNPPTEPEIEYTNAFSFRNEALNAVLDMGIGLRWEQTWCCDRFRTALDLGWEHHIWFSHSYRYNDIFLRDAGNDLLLRYLYLDNNLGYGGLVVRARWDF